MPRSTSLGQSGIPKKWSNGIDWGLPMRISGEVYMTPMAANGIMELIDLSKYEPFRTTKVLCKG